VVKTLDALSVASPMARGTVRWQHAAGALKAVSPAGLTAKLKALAPAGGTDARNPA
jgi:hypothetical protein